jgi:hypothetical protein
VLQIAADGRLVAVEGKTTNTRRWSIFNPDFWALFLAYVVQI